MDSRGKMHPGSESGRALIDLNPPERSPPSRARAHTPATLAHLRVYI